ncbi:unnamed protein product [Symbiodinium sp. CCMP2592]|nr:unnamed protein product [Symbiodinium sp. CCMP2592]
MTMMMIKVLIALETTFTLDQAAETAKDASFPDTGDAEEADDLFADYHPQAADKDLSQSFPEMEDGDATETFLETQLEKSGEELDLEKELEKEVDAAMEELSPAAAEVDVADKGATKPTMAQGTATLETELEKSGEDLDLEKELEKVMEAAMRGPDEAGCGLAVSTFQMIVASEAFFRPMYWCPLGSIVPAAGSVSGVGLGEGARTSDGGRAEDG